MARIIGTHSFDGACVPDGPYHEQWMRTFSVGIFEWVASKTEQPKRSKAKVRVKGLTADPESVYRTAREIIASLDAGTYHGPKTVDLSRPQREDTRND